MPSRNVQAEELTTLMFQADPTDLKGAVVYLASDASSFTTGSELRRVAEPTADFTGTKMLTC
jgi:hypothetical protein